MIFSCEIDDLKIIVSIGWFGFDTEASISNNHAPMLILSILMQIRHLKHNY